MLCILIIMFSILTSISFMFMNHPLTMSLILLIHALLISLTTGLMNLDFWFSYILFMIMIGGMLVLFLYMTSIASNKKFKFNMNIMLLNFIVFTIIMVYYFNNGYNMSTKNNYLIKLSLNKILNFSKFINYPFNVIMVLMIIYLFITLIAVVKITNITYGPLRNKL
uniref:NADH dehydrogenase subunit 6 n=1 Tax=Ptomascopus plagiatus TaxID=1035657 RepID=UPI0021D533EE|nr:NADH dehydrogenase subunit 6 [Ptomascopus plagiatus]UXC94695.1 NADH dehydrogenase subunit 6 [Ptomascopus plagiatus]